MPDKTHTHKIGDICVYSFGEKNKSRAIVEIVDLKKTQERVVAEIKFHEVMVDDTGNGLFNYLLKTGNTMCASLKYLPRLTVAIDGPAAAGKTTLAKRLAERFGITYIDTGAMFRAVALHALRFECAKHGGERPMVQTYRDLTPELADEILDTIDLKVVCDGPKQTIYLDGKAVADEELHASNISILASDISAFAKVRAFLLDKQRKIADNASVVMEGRDIGSVVLPDAVCKLYLTADLLVRAQRRYMDLRKSTPDIDPLKVVQDLAKRDRQDSMRKEAPLRVAEGAEVLDSTTLTADEVCDKAAEIIEAKLTTL